MTATIVNLGSRPERQTRDQRLLELVRDLSGAPAPEAEAAFHQAPLSATEPLERVAHALVQLRRTGALRVARYVSCDAVATTSTADIVPLPTLGVGPQWSASARRQLMRSATRSATTDSMQATVSPNERSAP